MAKQLDLAAPLVAAALDRCRFPDKAVGNRVDCAVSGGADSTALAILAVAAGFQATLIHVDHGWRADSSDEADLVRELSVALDCRFRSERVSVPLGPDLEARARRARYGVLPRGVLTGHTLDDQAETILLNLLRGSGLGGLAGMDATAEHPRRPLLALRRAETEGVCRAVGVAWLADPSNIDPAHRRNRVRHELVPLVNSIAERDVAVVIARQADLLRDEAALLDDLASDIDPTDARAVAAAPVALGRRALRQWLTSLDPERHPPSAATVERCLAVARNDTQATEIGGGRRLARHQQRLTIVGVATDQTPDQTPIDQSVVAPVK